MKKDYMVVDIVECIRALALDTNLDAATLEYIVLRFESEGIKFLTVVLPKFAQWVEASIDNGRLLHPAELAEGNPLRFTYFAWKNSFPRYFRGLLRQIFDEDGQLLGYPSPAALASIRQWGYTFYKLALPFTDEQKAEAERKYIAHEAKLATTFVDYSFVDSLRKCIEHNYRFPRLYDVLGSSRPRFGPGTFSTFGANKPDTAVREPYYKYKLQADSAQTFAHCDKGISGYFKPYPGCPTGLLRGIEDTSDLSEVLFVPKDSRGPRVISREPLKRLQLQMSFHDYFTCYFERVTKNRVNFQDQQVNRDLAKLGSEFGHWATIDLKDASDSVQGSVVSHLFRNIPSVNFFLKRRSREAILPSGLKVTLKKMSGMGSGLTFPLMAFLCHTAIAYEVSRQLAIDYSTATQFIYVYGDDIIVPTRWIGVAMDALCKVGLTVNDRKSFTSAHPETGICFRESCGGDYLGGVDVSPLRMKLTNSKVRYTQGLLILQSADNGIVELDALAANATERHLSSFAGYLYSVIEEYLGLKLPSKGSESPWIGRFSPDFRPLCDHTGTILFGSRLVPVPQFEENGEAAIHALLGQRLRVSPKEEIYAKGLFVYDEPTRWLVRPRQNASDQPIEDSSTYHYVQSVPRKFKIHRRNVLLR